jgi:hypothetical protein
MTSTINTLLYIATVLLLCFSQVNAQTAKPKPIFSVQLGALYHMPKTQKKYGDPMFNFGGFDNRLGYDARISMRLPFKHGLGINAQVGTSLQGRKQSPDTYSHFLASLSLGPSFTWKKWQCYALANVQYLIADDDPTFPTAKNDEYFISRKGDYGYLLGGNYKIGKHTALGLEYTRAVSPYFEVDLTTEAFRIYRRNVNLYLPYSF